MLIDIGNVDIELLKQQKLQLCKLIDNGEPLEGVLNLLDHIHDQIEPPEGVKPKPVQLYVATYSHKHGEDAEVFQTEEGAYHWRDDIATEYWGDIDDNPPTENIGEKYFEIMEESGREYFNVKVSGLRP